MKKILILLICISMLVGCGHKSDSELIDVEQFKCQDSIESVLSVMGDVSEEELKGEIFSLSETKETISYIYKYENVNVFGYKGTVVFDVRDDNNTIEEFECYLTLNDNEFDDLKKYFEEKYGAYVTDSFGDTINTYKWEVGEKDGKLGYEDDEVGYDSIVIQENGDKKYAVCFKDEWTYETDDVYYSKVEESQKESQIEILADNTYNIGSDTFHFSLGENAEGYQLTLMCDIADKSDAFSTHVFLNTLINSENEDIKAITEQMNFSYSISVGNETVIVRTNSTLLIMENKTIISVDEYFSSEWLASEEYRESNYGTQTMNFMIDFIENY